MALSMAVWRCDLVRIKSLMERRKAALEPQLEIPSIG